MGVKTRIGIGSLDFNGQGSVELPENIQLFCPQCGSMCADKGQCLISFIFKEDGKSIELGVDCRDCGCYGVAPVKE
jgi:hypothetical protein